MSTNTVLYSQISLINLVSVTLYSSVRTVAQLTRSIQNPKFYYRLYLDHKFSIVVSVTQFAYYQVVAQATYRFPFSTL